MTNTEHSSWRTIYQEALLETDPVRLQQKIDAAESAIFLRFQELAASNGQQHGERVALNEALRGIRALQTERLHHPKLPDEYQDSQ